MPEDTKKNDKRNAKEQRKPRQRHQQAKVDKKQENPEEPKSVPKVTVPQKPPVYESPPPEFYKNLKRETDEILKITEEENSKYKKKEIQSNWSKYEVPIESYDEIDEQENLGADYEKLIDASLSSGGHFQFKHEKSWDMNTGPSQYDKYFEINMEDLNIALCTIPFAERNDIEATLFSESDLLTMKNRSTRFKQKYFNDKSYSTPETVVQDKILNSLRSDMNNSEDLTKDTVEIEIKSGNENKESPLFVDRPTLANHNNLEPKSDPNYDNSNSIIGQSINIQNVSNEAKLFIESDETSKVDDIITHDDFIFRYTEKTVKCAIEKSESPNIEISDSKVVSQSKVLDIPPVESRITTAGENKVKEAVHSKVAAAVEIQDSPVAESPAAVKKNPAFESPEDLEKWLDDYLDG